MISNETRRRMVELIASGELSSYQIAARVHVTPSTVRKATRQLKQQQAGTYKPRGRSFYSERLIDLVPKTTKLDDVKSATIKANRLPLIKDAIEKRRKNLVVLADVSVIELPSVCCSERLAVAEFGSGRVLQTIMVDPASPLVRVLRLTQLATPHLHSSEVPSPSIDLHFRNQAAVQSVIEQLQELMKGFDQ